MGEIGRIVEAPAAVPVPVVIVPPAAPAVVPAPRLVLLLLANKLRLGMLSNALAGLVGSKVASGELHGLGWEALAVVLLWTGAALVGGGAMYSDSYYRPQLAQVNLVAAAKDVAVTTAAAAPVTPPDVPPDSERPAQ